MILQKQFKTTLSSLLSATATWEIQINLNIEPDSDMGFLLLENWTDKQESIFYHRKLGTSVFCYWVNRSIPTVHATWATVLLANSIDYMNYLLDTTYEQFYIYKKSVTDIIITWGTIYKNWITFTVEDLDTSEWLIYQTLTSDAANYIYLSTDNKIYITPIYDLSKYNIATVMVGIWWVISSITYVKSLIFNTVEFVDNLAIWTIDARIILQKEQPLWLATLDANWIVETYQLPAYIDDVLEYDTVAELPLEWVSWKIYIITTWVDIWKIYRWWWTVYVELTDTTAVWWDISWSILNQIDLQTALALKVSYESEFQVWDSWTSLEIDWLNWINQHILMTWNVTLTLTNPKVWATYMLKATQDVTGSRTITLPVSVLTEDWLWLFLTNTAGATDIISLYYDWTNYYANIWLNYA